MNVWCVSCFSLRYAAPLFIWLFHSRFCSSPLSAEWLDVYQLHTSVGVSINRLAFVCWCRWCMDFYASSLCSNPKAFSVIIFKLSIREDFVALFWCRRDSKLSFVKQAKYPHWSQLALKWTALVCEKIPGKFSLSIKSINLSREWLHGGIVIICF